MKPIEYEGVSGKFLTDEEFTKLTELILSNGKLIDQLYLTIAQQEKILNLHNISSSIVEEGVV